jgi:hypothetical protein
MKKDYSEYQLTDIEKYNMLRNGNNFLRYDYFINAVRFSEDTKKISILVDSSNEFEFMKEYLDEYDKFEEDHFGIKPTINDDEELAEMEERRIDGLNNNKEMFDYLSSKYNIGKDFFMTQQFYRFESEIKEQPLNNVLSGASIELSYGEGILDFIYADFKTLTVKELMLFQALNTLKSEVKKEMSETNPDSKPEKIYNKTQEIVDTYLKYTFTMNSIDKIAYQSLYSAICPPVFYAEFDLSDALRYYYTYLDKLQKEYTELIEFCFDETFYPELLGGLYPSERYGIFKQIHDLPSFSTRTETISISPNRMSGDTMPYGMPTEEVIARISKKSKPTSLEIELANKYGIDPKALVAMITVPYFIDSRYEFSTISDILDLELTKMFEANIRFRKCKRCGKYFIMKGNYDTNYCDRSANGESRTCQELAAQENYKNKIADNKSIPAYSKYYKRYSARVKARQIKEADFKKWKYEALTKRDECSDGKITLDEYVDWMEGSFPNRKSKT